MAMCLSGIPLNFIVLSFQLIAKILETSIEKQTDITACHTVFLKILLLNFRKIVERTASYFIVSLKKMFFFSIPQSLGMSKASLCTSSLKFEILMSVSLRSSLLFLLAKR